MRFRAILDVRALLRLFLAPRTVWSALIIARPLPRELCEIRPDRLDARIVLRSGACLGRAVQNRVDSELKVLKRREHVELVRSCLGRQRSLEIFDEFVKRVMPERHPRLP
jgi:hypothetical protein